MGEGGGQPSSERLAAEEFAGDRENRPPRPYRVLGRANRLSRCIHVPGSVSLLSYK